MYYVTVINQCDQTITDSVFIENTEVISLDLGEDATLCPSDLFEYTFDSNFESVEVYVDGDLYCSDCSEISLSIDTLISITAIVSSGACTAMDSLWVQPKEEKIISESIMLCEGDSVNYYDDIVSTAGTFLIPINDCDSLLELEVYIIPLDTIVSTEFYCIGDEVPIDEVFYTTDTTVLSKVENEIGCAHYLVSNLIFEEQGTIVEDYTICAGDSILIYGDWYKEEGVFESSIELENACDSLLEISIEFYDVDEAFEMIEICSMDSVLVNNEWISTDTTVIESYLSSDGCDSLIYTTISVNSRLSELDSLYVCDGDSLQVNGVFYSEEGLYETLYVDGGLCDSIYQFYVVERKQLSSPTLSLDCEAEEYTVFFDEDEEWMVEWSNGEEGGVIQSSGEELLVATAVSIQGCTQSYEVEVPIIPSFNTFDLPQEIEIEVNETYNLSLGIDTSEWDIQWLPSTYVDCLDCSEVNIKTDENGILYLVLTHEGGCSETYSILLSIKEPTIYLPNIFTPNDDGINDIWEVLYSENKIESIQCSIYDRWGNMVYRNREDSIVSWDGTFNRKNVQTGVYVSLVEVKFIDGREELKTGTIVVRR